MPKNRKRNKDRAAKKNCLCGKDILTTCSPLWNTVREKIERFPEKENTHSTQLSNVRLKFQKQRFHSGTQRCTKLKMQISQIEWRRIERPLTIRFAEALVSKRLASLVEPWGREENKHVVKLTLKSLVLFGLSNKESILDMQTHYKPTENFHIRVTTRPHGWLYWKQIREHLRKASKTSNHSWITPSNTSPRY